MPRPNPIPSGRPLRGHDLVRFLAVRNPTLTIEECELMARAAPRPGGDRGEAERPVGEIPDRPLVVDPVLTPAGCYAGR